MHLLSIVRNLTIRFVYAKMALLQKNVEKVVKNMRKKILFALVLIALTAQFVGCTDISNGETHDGGIVTVSDTSGAFTSNSGNEQSDIPLSMSETVAETEAADVTSETQDNEITAESRPQTEQAPVTEPVTMAEETQANNNEPTWTETAVSGELYVNTDYIYSRVNAIQGSERVKQYRLGDKVTVVAKTDTDYFKLNDGTFIHEDYLSENEIPVNSQSGGEDYIAVTSKGYSIERKDGITYVDGIMIANKTYTLPSSYDPGIKKEAADALAEMQSAAAAEGISLFVVSGYRSYYSQQAVYAGWVSQDGVEKADTYSSRPGHSDHQTGYTFDLNSLSQSFAYTKEGIWLAEHCAEFGFIIRYPDGKEMYTGYMYEPWHVRYIGKEKARVITESGLSLEEYYGFTSDYADCETFN